MNLRNAQDYSIGLDIGTNSVGWAVISPDGELYKFKGKNTWGVRLFDQADTAASTRAHRSQRRRYDRRKQRLADLQELVSADMNQIDPEFFLRLKQSSLFAEDRTFEEQYVFFNDKNFDQRAFNKKYPTIYHLRAELVENKEKADFRLIYLAMHHLIKYRGNFLVDGEVSAKSAGPREAATRFKEAVKNFAEATGLDIESENIDINSLCGAITGSGKRAMRRESFMGALGFTTEFKKRAEAISKAVFNYEVELSELFELEKSADTKLKLSNDEKVDKLGEMLTSEESVELFESIKELYNAYLLAGILKGESGKTISFSMISKYEAYGKDLKELKGLVKRTSFATASNQEPVNAHNAIFRGDAALYNLYSSKHGSYSQDVFYTDLKKFFNGASFVNEVDEALWNNILGRMEDQTFLSRLRTYENGAIPHQLHLEELHEIIENQKQYYPSLQENQEKIESLLTFRIPYYVGPLGKNKNSKRTFSWATRNPEMEDIAVKPWNFEEVIDKETTAEEFITRMTGECTYWYGKKSIPKNSLLYSEFCVRQELNGCRISQDGGCTMHRFDIEAADSIVNGVFKKRKKVKVKDVLDYLKKEYPNTSYGAVLTGTQKENEFASSLTSYNDFKKILGREIETRDDYEMVEELILWVTLFEDKDILKHKIDYKYGPKSKEPRLDSEQVKQICKLRYTGWSRLSREFLTELKTDFMGTRLSIMDVLRDSQKREPMILMEILADDRFKFKDILKEKNDEYLASNEANSFLESIPGSPAIKRGINQALKVVDEIVSIIGQPPASIIIEMAREEVGKGKGDRTKTRAKKLEESYAAVTSDLMIGADSAFWKKKLSEYKDQLDKEEIYLYLMQRGKCMYCGETIDIENPASLHVDHIVPRTLIKDDSIENKVLCHYTCNERKGDIYPIKSEMKKPAVRRLWAELHDAKLIGGKKHENLKRSELSDKQKEGFINRQLVETRQISKYVVQLLQAKYAEKGTTVQTINAELSHNLRIEYGYIKNRDVNDFHHAHDAYLACQLSRFITERYAAFAKGLDYSKYRWISEEEKKQKRGHSGLIVNSFKISGFDAETGEIKRDSWDGPFEMQRIRKCLNYHDCFVSRKTEMLTGEFWNQTVYSPKNKTEKAIPLKANLNPEKYGYYMSPNSAYYALIEHSEEVRGKDKRKVELVGIPVNASYSIDSEEDLLKHLETRFDSPRILKWGIKKYQKIIWDGAPYYLTSQSEMINGRQLCLPEKYLRELDAEEPSPETLDECFEYLCEMIKELYPRYKGVYTKLSSEKTKAAFDGYSRVEKKEALEQLLCILHCDARRGLKKLGLSDRDGRMDSLNIGASVSNINFVDTSITGMFERTYGIEF